MATMRQIIDAVLKRLSMVDGVSVQPYSEAKIADMLQDTFTTWFDLHFWKDFRSTEVFTLDGVTGVITADISTKIKRFADIQYIWVNSAYNDAPIPEVSGQSNPTRVNVISFEPFADVTKRFIIRPITTTGEITVRYRTRPNDFVEADEIPMDVPLLKAALCYQFLDDRGDNSSAADRYRRQYESRLAQLEKNEMLNSKSLYYAGSQNNTEWRDA